MIFSIQIKIFLYESNNIQSTIGTMIRDLKLEEYIYGATK